MTVWEWRVHSGLGRCCRGRPARALFNQGDGIAGAVKVVLEGMQAGRVYQLNLENLKSKDGTAIQNRLFYYTGNELPGEQIIDPVWR